MSKTLQTVIGVYVVGGDNTKDYYQVRFLLPGGTGGTPGPKS